MSHWTRHFGIQHFFLIFSLRIYTALICRYFSYFIISSKSLYNVANFICHTIPGYILDGVAGLSGRKQM